jgi:hypothetical protein
MEKNLIRLVGGFLLSAFIVSAAAAEENGFSGGVETGSALKALLSDGVSPSDGMPAVPAPGKAASSAEPVVIAVSGLDFKELGWGPLEVKNLIKIARTLLPCNEKSAGKAYCSTGDMRAFEQAVDRYNSQYDSLREVAAGESSYKAVELPSDRNYIRQALDGAPFTVVPFDWSRDPKDTAEVVADFTARLKKLSAQYKDSGRPIRILCHSWGTIIMHSVLRRLAEEGSDVKIDKFITIGSPLMPGNAIVDLFVFLEITRADLEEAGKKPANIGTWNNLWASRDPFSNKIASADYNYQVDAGVGRPEDELKGPALHLGAAGLQAKKDLFKIKDVRPWHSSYFTDYKVYLQTLNRSINITVFQPRVLTPLSAR